MPETETTKRDIRLGLNVDDIVMSRDITYGIIPAEKVALNDYEDCTINYSNAGNLREEWGKFNAGFKGHCFEFDKLDAIRKVFKALDRHESGVIHLKVCRKEVLPLVVCDDGSMQIYGIIAPKMGR